MHWALSSADLREIFPKVIEKDTVTSLHDSLKPKIPHKGKGLFELDTVTRMNEIPLSMCIATEDEVHRIFRCNYVVPRSKYCSVIQFLSRISPKFVTNSLL